MPAQQHVVFPQVMSQAVMPCPFHPQLAESLPWDLDSQLVYMLNSHNR